MTLNEFKAWMEGFEASFSPKGAGPDAKQWTAIKAKLEKVAAPVAAPSITPKNLLPGIWPHNQPSARYRETAAAPRTVGPNQTVMVS